MKFREVEEVPVFSHLQMVAELCKSGEIQLLRSFLHFARRKNYRSAPNSAAA